MRLESLQSAILVDAFGFVVEQHGVAVEGNAHFVGVLVAGLHGSGGHPSSRKLERQRLPHVILIGRQEQVSSQRAQVAERIAALREYAAFDQIQAVGGGGAEHAHAADRVVARQHDHLDAALALAVEGKQFLDQREGHAGGSRLVQLVELCLHVAVRVPAFEQPVLRLEIEERAGGKSDDQLAFQGSRHDGSGNKGTRHTVTCGFDDSAFVPVACMTQVRGCLDSLAPLCDAV